MQHTLRFGESGDRQQWECSCGNAGSVGEFGDVDAASWKHIPAEGNHQVLYSNKSMDDPW